VGAPLSGSLPSTWNSRWPRGRWTALGRAPCSYSSGSRTSRKVTPPPSSRACASAWSTSRMDAFASLRRSRGVATLYLRVAVRPSVRPAPNRKTLPAGSTFPNGPGSGATDGDQHAADVVGLAIALDAVRSTGRNGLEVLLDLLLGRPPGEEVEDLPGPICSNDVGDGPGSVDRRRHDVTAGQHRPRLRRATCVVELV